MSRSAQLREQAEWAEMLAFPAWARLCAHLETLQATDREALETVSPDNVALPRTQGRIEGRKQALGYPAARVAEILTEMKESKSDGKVS